MARTPGGPRAVVTVTALALVAVAACSSSGGSVPAPTGRPAGPTSTVAGSAKGDGTLLYDGAPIFGPASFWTASVADAPVNPDSPAIVADLQRQVREHNGGVASFNVWKYNAAILTVRGSQPRIDIAFDDCQHKGHTPRGLTGDGGQFTGVPLPADAIPNPGTDSALALISPDTHELWEFWKLKKGPGGWSACWGGHIADTRTNPGYFADGFGASASGLAGVAGAVHLQDVRSGRIDHALTIAIPAPAPWKQVSWPAQRSDGGSTNMSPIRMGTRLRLPASVDVNSLPLSDIGKLIAHAAQDHGLIVSETAGTVSIGGESGAAEQLVTGVNPWTRLLAGERSFQVLHDFPWGQLEALPFDYGRPTSAGG